MPGPVLDLSKPRRLHLVGVGGSGMAPLATILAAMGHAVSGSDVAPSARLDRLRRLGVGVHVGHEPANVGDAEVVVASTAVTGDNPEVAAARGAGLTVLRRAEALAAVCATRRTLAVGGTHGKTTTTAMVAAVLEAAGMAPSFLVGADVVGLDGGAAWSAGEWFVVEADESDGTFVELGAEAVIVTNVEADHLDHHGSLEALQAAFARFVAAAAGPRVVCVDDPGAAALAGGIDCLTYGASPEARFRVRDVEVGRAASTFALSDGQTVLARLEVAMPGHHNVLDAAAAAVTGLALGAGVDDVARGLAGFKGVARRFEWRGEAAGVTFVDSYDHLPGEVAAVLAAARHGGWRRVVCVFQPHRHTRTAALWREFGAALAVADLIGITEIYGAGQAPLPGVSGKLIVDSVLDAAPGRRVAWLPSRRDVLSWLTSVLAPGDLCLTLGAGDLTTVPDEVRAALARRR